MQFHAPLWTYVALVAVALECIRRRWISRIPRGLQLPPGPPRRFLIGNLLDLPTSKEWVTYNRWAKAYGDLVYVKIFGFSLLFVNSYELAKEVFEKRGSIYSHRPHSVVLNELAGMDWAIFMMPYGEKLRQVRAYFHQFFNPIAVKEFHEVHIKHTRAFLKLLYRSPERFRSHIRFTTGAVILEVAYGIKASSDKDPYIVLSEETALELSRTGVPGTYLVDALPVLKYIPMWFPGAKFRRELHRLRGKVQETVNKPFKFVSAALKEGTAVPSVASSFIEQLENDPDRPAAHDEDEDLVKHFTAAIYMAGIDTTDANILLFFRAMLLHPEVQERAYKELHDIVGSGALPSFDDSERLKYIWAIVYEVLRWNTVAPVGLPHVLQSDDVINGYFVPKGTIVIGNSWTLLRSESVYGKDADKFKPERFLDKDTPLPEFGFGFGRRICPGRHFAENAMFATFACVLHLFRILPAHGENGPDLPGEEDYDSGVVLRPKDFKCRIVPRSSSAVKILEELNL